MIYRQTLILKCHHPHLSAPYPLYKEDPPHCGLKGISEYLINNNIPLNIHGHNHNNSIELIKNGTISISVYGAAIIDLSELNIIRI
jgi:Icc-related predicted phosphoesterase